MSPRVTAGTIIVELCEKIGVDPIQFSMMLKSMYENSLDQSPARLPRNWRRCKDCNDPFDRRHNMEVQCTGKVYGLGIQRCPRCLRMLRSKGEMHDPEARRFWQQLKAMELLKGEKT